MGHPTFSPSLAFRADHVVIDHLRFYLPSGHPVQPPFVTLRAKLHGNWTTFGLSAYARAVALRQRFSFSAF